MRFTRISVNRNQIGGAPCLRGLRIPVATVVGMNGARLKMMCTIFRHSAAARVAGEML